MLSESKQGSACALGTWVDNGTVWVSWQVLSSRAKRLSSHRISEIAIS